MRWMPLICRTERRGASSAGSISAQGCALVRLLLDYWHLYKYENNVVNIIVIVMIVFRYEVDCWDPYCNRCFLVVHHVGSLLRHRSAKYANVQKVINICTLILSI